MYETAVGSRVIPQPTYGFSRGSRSIASPYACIDHVPVRPPLHGDAAACRHSNDAVTSPFGFGLGPYMAAKDITRIGNRIAYSFPKTRRTDAATARLTTIW